MLENNRLVLCTLTVFFLYEVHVLYCYGSIICPNVSQFMSQGFTPTHALLDLLLELLPGLACLTSLYYVRIAETFPFPLLVSVSSVYSCPSALDS